MFARNIAYRAARLLPAPVFAYLRKRHRRNVAIRRQQDRATTIARHGMADAAELLATLRQFGISPGGVLFVQSSFNDMHTFAGKPEARSLGAPLVLSDLDVHREQAGTAATYFQRHSAASLADALDAARPLPEAAREQRLIDARSAAEARVRQFAADFATFVADCGQARVHP